MWGRTGIGEGGYKSMQEEDVHAYCNGSFNLE